MMGFPVDYLFDGDGYDTDYRFVKEWLERNNLVATRKTPAMDGLISRVRIDAFGTSAAEVEATLLEYSSRCDSAAQRPSCAYGQCVIERNLEEQWGHEYSWKGRLVLHPDIGVMPESERASKQIAETYVNVRPD